jgi:hypothetical protein
MLALEVPRLRVAMKLEGPLSICYRRIMVANPACLCYLVRLPCACDQMWGEGLGCPIRLHNA